MYSLQTFWDYLLFPKLLKIKKNIPLSFKFEINDASQNNINVGIVVQTIENE